jgi:hypothetical protein
LLGLEPSIQGFVSPLDLRVRPEESKPEVSRCSALNRLLLSAFLVLGLNPEDPRETSDADHARGVDQILRGRDATSPGRKAASFAGAVRQ